MKVASPVRRGEWRNGHELRESRGASQHRALLLPYSDKWVQQTKAASHIRQLLIQCGFNIPSRKLDAEDEAQWVIFEYERKQLGKDFYL